jgi:hypothetical protein
VGERNDRQSGIATIDRPRISPALRVAGEVEDVPGAIDRGGGFTVSESVGQGAVAGQPRLTFETEAQRIWRVRKQFGTRGSSYLEESRNGLDYDEVERARRVDAKLREILRWGIPEPGGTGAGKGLPTSFLATALLSTQADVTDVLGRSLHDDGTASGKDQIAAALQAVAQDPLFLALLRQTQARRDEAFTDRGAKKTARGSVFKVAADRVKEAREEVERLQKIVEDSEDVEGHLGDLYQERQRCDGEQECRRRWDESGENSDHRCHILGRSRCGPRQGIPCPECPAAVGLIS